MTSAIPTQTAASRARNSSRVMVRLARATWILSMLLLVSSAVLFFLSRLSPLNTASNLILLVAFASFGTVGMLITVQRSQNTVGWILCAMGVTTGTTAFSAAYAQYNSSLPGAGDLTVLGNVVWPINLVLPLI